MKRWGDESAKLIPESTVDLCIVFSYPFFTTSVKAPRTMKVVVKGKLFMFFGISNPLTILTTSPTH